ncbi:MAG: transglutaminase TgpA family protein [Candidatus Dormibacteria bacterium]
MKRFTSGARVPEQSLPGRMAILGAAGVADIAMAVTAGATLTALVCLPLVCLGHRVSWRGRNKPRTAVGQAVLGLLIVGCLAYLVADLTAGIFGGALPQAKFAVLMQAVTSFDLKSRRNLFTHLWHSGVILYVGALFAWNPYFLPFVLAWACCMFAFLYFTRRERPRGPRPRLARWTVAWLAVSGVLFVGMPHFAGRPIAVPLLVSIPMSDQSTAEVLPTVLPLVGTAPGPGNDQSINLRVRGRLGEEVMFRVRAPASAYWRAYTLQKYTGQSWARVSRAARAISPISTDLTADDEGPTIGTLPQSIFIENPVPADVLVAYPVKELYFPARGLALVETGTVHSPIPLRRGVNYSAVSAVRDLSARRLRLAGAITREEHVDDLQIPSSLPHRVNDLAYSVASGRTNEYDRVAAITDYLRTHYRYSLDTPRLPSGTDAVDRFLFSDHVGYCEQFASTLAMMLRTQGVPARLAVGYSTGERDNLTGSFTVQARDAHAWVEVLFPGVGWVPFDASPGFAELPGNHLPARWLLSDLSPQLALTGLAGAPGGAAGVGAAVLAVALIVVLILVSRRYRLPARTGPVRSYLWAQRWLRWLRLPSRAPADTPLEHLAALTGVAPVVAQALAPLVGALETASFAGGPVVRRSSIPVIWAALRRG